LDLAAGGASVEYLRKEDVRNSALLKEPEKTCLRSGARNAAKDMVTVGNQEKVGWGEGS